MGGSAGPPAPQWRLSRRRPLSCAASSGTLASTRWRIRRALTAPALSAASRPTAAEIAEAPALDWASEWRLNELSPTETEVVRTAFRFVQHTRREHALESPFSFFRWVQAAIMPMHWMLPLICSNEHELIVKTFLEAAR